jgi:hypothetical protein
MIYELMPKEVLDEISAIISEIGSRDETSEEISLLCKRAYNSIQHNRTQCNVKPEDGA